MKRTLSVFALTALMFLVGAVVLGLRSSNWAPGDSGYAMADTTATKGTPATEKAEEKKENSAEEKKESPTQEKAEEKSEAKMHHGAHKAKAMKMPMVDINSASKEDLMKVPGLTDAIADKIIASRPFASRSELLSKKILTSAEYGKIKAKVVAKKQKAATK
jgi:competence protein ComEA